VAILVVHLRRPGPHRDRSEEGVRRVLAGGHRSEIGLSFDGVDAWPIELDGWQGWDA
jgi:hypothetical protein